MNKIILILILTVLFSVTSFSQRQKGKFEIEGKLAGFTDSLLIYLDNDSTFLINNKFHFSGSIKENRRFVLLKVNNSRDYKFFWLENSAIIFKAAKGKFRDAIISGSTTQNEQNKLDAAIKAGGDEKEQDMLFIRSHPNSIISAEILSAYASIWGRYYFIGAVSEALWPK